MEGIKYDNGKPMWSLLPLDILEETVSVLTFGAKKYSPDNWKKIADIDSRYFSACLRHLTAWQRGEKTDPESGLSHLSHAMCCLIFMMWKEKNGSNMEKTQSSAKQNI